MSTSYKMTARWLGLPLLAAALLIVSWTAATAPSHADFKAPKATAEESLYALTAAHLQTARDSEFGLLIDLEREKLQLVFGAAVMREVDIPGVRWSTDSEDRALGLGGGYLVGRRGTLPFEPVQRVQAPPDTASAEPPALRPLDSHPAYGVLILDNGLEVRLEPTDLKPGEWLPVTLFRAGSYLSDAGKIVGRLVTFRSAPDRQVVRVPMTDNDARAVYRAMPEGAPVYVRYPSGS